MGHNSFSKHKFHETTKLLGEITKSNDVYRGSASAQRKVGKGGGKHGEAKDDLSTEREGERARYRIHSYAARAKKGGEHARG